MALDEEELCSLHHVRALINHISASEKERKRKKGEGEREGQSNRFQQSCCQDNNTLREALQQTMPAAHAPTWARHG